MHERFVDWLACPACRGDLRLEAATLRNGQNVREGTLACVGCGATYPIRRSIPRFAGDTGYVDSFAWQWERWHLLQRDSYNGTRTLREGLLRRTGWTPELLRGKSFLECGCASGNDTEIWASLVGTLISLDLSNAVDQIPESIRESPDALVLQADIFRIPLKEGRFDCVSCHRVIQHTPDPEAAFRSMARAVRPGGELFVHSYDTHWKSLLQAKYLWRPLTTRLPHHQVYRALRVVGPVLYPLVGALRRVGFLRKPVKLLIPFRNLSRGMRRQGTKLTEQELYVLSLLVTFDALTPRYDIPNSPRTIGRWFAEAGFTDVALLGRNPVKMKGRRPETGYLASSSRTALEPQASVSASETPPR